MTINAELKISTPEDVAKHDSEKELKLVPPEEVAKDDSENELKLITPEEVAKHDSENDCWMVMHKLVFNLPKQFLDDHPGGPDVVSCLAGKDATCDFEDIAHSDSARDWANKYIIGYMEGIDDDIKMAKRIPKTSELKSKPGGGGEGLMILLSVLVVGFAAVAYFVLKA
eukprot:CAMPEP_0172720092 /NCGR_PEP_ID=MMETSP1074-20121228/76094_1 /TAXON_ID=2916 /ORGANISM="Ceratium fusus, Strain PA161109" /LENGTH=168 /DNA_ID=CAMNT_0013545529 /DNA_START=76 /DNA_END=582 /DNA_ORIENTATION=+